MPRRPVGAQRPAPAALRTRRGACAPRLRLSKSQDPDDVRGRPLPRACATPPFARCGAELFLLRGATYGEYGGALPPAGRQHRPRLQLRRCAPRGARWTPASLAACLRHRRAGRIHPDGVPGPVARARRPLSPVARPLLARARGRRARMLHDRGLGSACALPACRPAPRERRPRRGAPAGRGVAARAAPRGPPGRRHGGGGGPRAVREQRGRARRRARRAARAVGPTARAAVQARRWPVPQGARAAHPFLPGHRAPRARPGREPHGARLRARLCGSGALHPGVPRLHEDEPRRVRRRGAAPLAARRKRASSSPPTPRSRRSSRPSWPSRAARA